jgi:hypothetical protein
MPSLEAIDYDTFTIEGAGERPLTLDEAVKKASQLRRKDVGNNFYRIVRVDENKNAFIVRRVAAASVYADFAARVSKLLGRYKLRTGTR